MKIKKMIFPLIAVILSSCHGVTSDQISSSSLPSPSPTKLDNMKTINEYHMQYDNQTGLPSIGNLSVLVIPIEINDFPFPNNYQETLHIAFNGSKGETGWESVSSYYQKSSYGQLNLSFDIIDKYVSPHDRAYFEEYANAGDQMAIIESLYAIEGIEYSKYDNNNDNFIDSVVFIYSAPSNYEVQPWWGWVYSGDFFYLENELSGDVELGYYMWVSYDFMFQQTLNVEVALDTTTYIHEVGHLLGLPDYYPYSGKVGPMGGFDMMDFNVGDHGPFNKMMLGWLDPLYVEAGHEYTLSLESYALSNNGDNVALVIPSPTTNIDDGDLFDEYLLLMYYTPDGLYEQHLGMAASIEQPGIVIYHVSARVNYSIDTWMMFSFDNDGNSHFLLSILEVDLNSSIPSPSKTISANDILLSGRFDCASYYWHSGDVMDVVININSMSDNEANITVDVY